MKKINVVFFIGVIIFLLYGLYSYLSGVYEYIMDALIVILLVFVLFLLKKELNLNYCSLGHIVSRFKEIIDESF